MKLEVQKTSFVMVKNKKQKSFDAVHMMREIRNQISAETQNMTFEELNAYIKKKLLESNTKLVGR